MKNAMHTITALNFPEATPDNKTVGRLLCFFDRIFSYLPVEPDADATEVYAYKDLCTAYAPFPLGPELTRFNQLINDIKGHEDEYYKNYLSSLSLNMIKDKDDVSVWSVISSITGAAPPTASGDDKNSQLEKEWQARLLVKLAEIQAQEEREVAAGLAAIETRKAELLHTLKGESSEEETTAGEISIPCFSLPETTRFTAATKQIVRAWAHLFINDRTRTHQIVVTSQETASSLLTETYEKLCKTPPAEFFRIKIPNLGDPETDIYYDERSRLFEATRNCREKLSQLLQDMHNDAIDASGFAEAAAEWDRTTSEEGWNTTEKSQGALVFYSFKDIGLRKLFLTLCGEKEKESPDADAPQHGIMAVLE